MDDASSGARTQLTAQVLLSRNAKLNCENRGFSATVLFEIRTGTVRVREANKPLEGCGISDNIPAIFCLVQRKRIELKASENCIYPSKIFLEIPAWIILKRRKNSVKISRQNFQVWLAVADPFEYANIAGTSEVKD